MKRRFKGICRALGEPPAPSRRQRLSLASRAEREGGGIWGCCGSRQFGAVCGWRCGCGCRAGRRAGRPSGLAEKSQRKTGKRKKKKGKKEKKSSPSCGAKLTGGGRRGRGWGRGSSAAAEHGGSGAGCAPPRRACGRGRPCSKGPAKSCSKSDKPSGKWTRGAARAYFFIPDNLCPKETILKIIEMITIHCRITLNMNSQIMKSG